MRSLIFVFALTTMSSVYAQENKCLSRVRGLLESKTEIYLYEKQKSVADFFTLECRDTNFGNTLYSADATVFVHEAAHFEDLGMGKDNFDPNNQIGIFNLYTVNNEHIGNFQNFKNLPKVKDVIIPYLEKEKKEFLEPTSIYGEMHFTYIGADDEPLASDVIQGMATELNGYTHGAITQAKVMKMLPNPAIFKDDEGNEYNLPNPHIENPTQIDGVLYFIYNFNLYLRLLKEKHPDQWKEFYTSSNKEYLRKLLTPSLDTLKKLGYCNLKDSFKPANYYINEFLKEDMSVLEDVLGKEKLGELLCSEKTLISGLSLLEKKDNSCQEE